MSGDPEPAANAPTATPAASPTSSAAPALRPVTPDDLPALHDLLTRHLPDVIADENRWAARWRWQYWDNPYRQDRPAGWVLADGDRILGHLGVVYVPLRVANRAVIGAIGADYAVADEAIARGGTFIGLALAQNLFEACKDCVVMATTANEKTAAVFGRFGCQSIEWTREFWRARASLGQQIRACRGGSSRIVRRLFNSTIGSSLLRWTAGVYRLLGHRPAIPIPPGCWLETTVPQLARDLGRFCTQSASGEAGAGEAAGSIWTVDRSQAYLDWRYARHPERENSRVLVVRDEEGSPIAAAVVFVDERADRHLLYVEELIALPQRDDMIKTLLCAALRLACDHGATHLVTMPGRRSLRPIFWELGCKDRSRNAPAAVIQPAPASAPDGFPPLADSLADHVDFWHGIMF